MSDGTTVTRPGQSQLLSTWRFAYNWLTETDRQTLLTFQKDTVHGKADPFFWTHPAEQTVYLVQFAAAITWRPQAIGPVRWRAEIELIEYYRSA